MAVTLDGQPAEVQAESGKLLKLRYIPWIMLAAMGMLVAVLGAIGSHRTTAATVEAGPGRGQPAVRRPDHALERHYVGPRQLADSNSMVERRAGDFRATAQDGRCLGWDELSGGRPVVLIFIKQDCPCSVEVEPFFQRVEKAYSSETRFAGVIDAGTKEAARYAVDQGVTHPVFADPGRQLIRRFRALNGCYVVLLTSTGVIDGAWPGFSSETVRHLGRRIARLAGVEERPLDVSGLPAGLTTGCRFKS
jgi:peroxiredoxin